MKSVFKSERVAKKRTEKPAGSKHSHLRLVHDVTRVPASEAQLSTERMLYDMTMNAADMIESSLDHHMRIMSDSKWRELSSMLSHKNKLGFMSLPLDEDYQHEDDENDGYASYRRQVRGM